MTKLCTTCNTTKDVSEFYTDPCTKDGYNYKCKECRKAYDREYKKAYKLKHKDKILAQARIHTANYRNKVKKETGSYPKDYRKAKLMVKVLAYLAEHPCADCGETNPVVLEFHHTDPNTKSGTISQMIRVTKNWQCIQEEINKCIVLCANCHRIVTAKMQGWYTNQLALPV